MHCLFNTLIEQPNEFFMTDSMTYYPVKIELSKTKVRVLYLLDKDSANSWCKAL